MQNKQPVRLLEKAILGWLIPAVLIGGTNKLFNYEYRSDTLCYVRRDAFMGATEYIRYATEERVYQLPPPFTSRSKLYIDDRTTKEPVDTIVTLGDNYSTLRRPEDYPGHEYEFEFADMHFVLTRRDLGKICAEK